MKLKIILPSCAITLSLFLCYGCFRDSINEQASVVDDSSSRTLESLITRSSGYNETDSLTIMSYQQSDLDNFMMGRIIFKENQYELCLKREDANFFGVSDEMYDEYVAYVERLNALARQ